MPEWFKRRIDTCRVFVRAQGQSDAGIIVWLADRNAQLEREIAVWVEEELTKEREVFRKQLLKLERRPYDVRIELPPSDRAWNSALAAVGVWLFKRMAKIEDSPSPSLPAGGN